MNAPALFVPLFVLGLAAMTPAAEIRGQCWIDQNQDGIRQASETLGATTSRPVTVRDAGGTSVGFTTTAANGSWSVAGLAAGTYTVQISPPYAPDRFTLRDAGSDDSIDSDVDPTTGLSATISLAAFDIAQVDAGFISAQGRISGRLWVDANRNGLRDAGESTVPAYPSITLEGPAPSTAATVVPVAPDGTWASALLAPGSYRVRAIIPFGTYAFTAPDAGADDSIDSDILPEMPTNIGSRIVTVLGNVSVVDAGVLDQRGVISGRFWIDANRDGIRGAGETAVPAYPSISLEGPAPSIAATVVPVAPDGTWASALLAPGSYRVRAIVPYGTYAFTATDAGANDSVDSDIFPEAPTNTGSRIVAVLGNASVVDAGVLDQHGMIAGRVWFDRDADGLKDPGEGAVPDTGLQVELGSGGTLSYAPVAADGTWSSGPLLPGDWIVRFVVPADLRFSPLGGDSAADPISGAATVPVAPGASGVCSAGLWEPAPITALTVVADAGTASPIPFTLTFDRPVAAVPTGALTVVNGNVIAISGGPSAWTVSVAPLGGGAVAATLPAGAVATARGTAAGGASATTLSRLPPRNDAFANATAIDGASGTVAGLTRNGSRQTNEPKHASVTGSSSAWWTWTAPAAGTLRVNTVGSSFDTLLGIYTGTAVNALTKIGANNNRATGDSASEIAIAVVAGTAYRIAVDGVATATGDVVLTWAFVPYPANDGFAQATILNGATGSVAATTIGATRETGEPKHAGVTGAASVWFTWSAPANGSVTIDTLGSPFDTLLAAYTGSSVAALTAVKSNNNVSSTVLQSRIAFAATAGTTYRIAVDGAAAGNVTLTWTFVPYPPNDGFAQATVLNGTAGTLTATTIGATRETGEPKHAGVTGAASVWFAWTAPANGSVTIDTLGSPFDTLLAAYTGSSVAALTTVKSNNNVSSTVLQGRITFTATAGTTYRIAVDGVSAASGPVTLTWAQVPTGNG